MSDIDTSQPLVNYYFPVTDFSQYKTYLFLCTLHAVVGIVAGFLINQVIKNLMDRFPKIPLAIYFVLQLFFAVSLMFLLQYYSNEFAYGWTSSTYGIIFITLYFMVQENFIVYFNKLFYY